MFFSYPDRDHLAMIEVEWWSWSMLWWWGGGLNVSSSKSSSSTLLLYTCIYLEIFTQYLNIDTFQERAHSLSTMFANICRWSTQIHNAHKNIYLHMLISYISYIQKHSKTNQKTYSGTWQLAKSNTFASRLLIEIRAGRIIIKVNKTHFGKCNTNTKHGTAKHVNQKGKVFMMQWGKWTTCVSFWSHMSWFGNDYNMLCIRKPLSEMRCFHMAHWASSVRGGSV